MMRMNVKELTELLPALPRGRKILLQQIAPKVLDCYFISIAAV